MIQEKMSQNNFIEGGNFAMDTTTVTNAQLPITNNLTIGSFTTGNFQPPQGQVMKLVLPNLPEDQTQDQPQEQNQKTPPPLFGAHIREGIAVVKDWMKKP
jgi:hypothetical protein